MSCPCLAERSLKPADHLSECSSEGNPLQFRPSIWRRGEGFQPHFPSLGARNPVPYDGFRWIADCSTTTQILSCRSRQTTSHGENWGTVGRESGKRLRFSHYWTPANLTGILIGCRLFNRRLRIDRVNRWNENAIVKKGIFTLSNRQIPRSRSNGNRYRPDARFEIPAM
jgi:hypothetical protein